MSRRGRDSSPKMEIGRVRRDRSPEETRRVRQRMEDLEDRSVSRREMEPGRRERLRKDSSDFSDDDDRPTRRSPISPDPASVRSSRRREELADGKHKREDLRGIRTTSAAVDDRTGKDAGDIRLQREEAIQARRKISPSPKASPHFSADESEASSGDRSRSDSLALSPTPERATLTKPPRATPDERRGMRSPNPSPLSPRSRVPPHGRLSPLLSYRYSDGVPRLADWRRRADGGISSRVDDHERHGANNGETAEELKPEEDGEVARTGVDDRNEDCDLLDRWVPEEGAEDKYVHYRGENGNASPRNRDYDNPSLKSRREGWTDDRKTSRLYEREKGGVERDSRGYQSRYSQSEKEVNKGGEGDVEDRVRARKEDNSRRAGDRDQNRRDGTFIGRGRYNGRYGNRDAETTGRRDVGREADGDSYGRNGERTPWSRDSGKDVQEKDPKNREETKWRQDTLEPPLVMAQKDGPSEVVKVARERPVLPPGRSGGVYIPPFKLAQMMKDSEDKSSNEYQRLTWDALRKSINGLVNKVNASNLKNILPELFAENLIRGRGLFARSCMKSQMASPSFTHVFAGLVAVVNTKFPELGELLLKRIILQLRRAFKRNDKPVLLAAAKFIAHLVNQQVAHELLGLQLLTVLLENPTDDSVEVAVGFVKECGSVLQSLSPQGLHGIFERFRGILHEGEIDKRVQFMIEGLFAIRKAKFQGFPGVLPELDLVEEDNQFTHNFSLDDELDDESFLDVFKPDPNFLENEKKYEGIKKEILGDESDEDGAEDADSGSDENESDEEEDEDEMEQRMQIQDETETNLVNLRRTIYLTIMSSVDFEEAGHKLLKIKLEPGQEMELCLMLLECCMQERTYLRYYGLLGQRFCLINRVYQENFDQCFVKQYSMIHRLETNKLRNVAKFFAHLLGTDALPWQALAYIRLTEEDTTSSSRIFIKILFQELSEHLGLRKLNERLSDPMMQESFDGIFPRDNPKNTRFAINFFTSVGLGGLTDNLRAYLKNMPRLIMQQHPPAASDKDSDLSSSESLSASDSSESESDTSSDDSSDESTSSSDDEGSPRKTNRKTKKR